MNKKQRKAKKLGCVVTGLATLVQFYAAIVCSMWEDWYGFGLFLAGCIITHVFFVGIFISLGVDMRFNQLEKHIDELKDKKPKDE